jgi:hypothetical protein
MKVIKDLKSTTMRNRYAFFYIIMMVIVFTSCKNDPIMFDKSKTFVAFVAPSASVYENASSIDIPVMVAGIEGSPSVTVDYDIVTDGIANPAVEGTDFTIVSPGSLSFTEGTGYAFITIHPIDNAVFTGNKSFKIVLSANSKNYPTGAENVVTVVLKDDEHPLAKWIGTYMVNAVSYYSPGEYDETWEVTTEADPKDINNLLITGVGAFGSDTIKAKFDLEEMTISLIPGQSIGDVYNVGNVAVYKGTDAGDDVIMNEPLIGVIEEDGTIKIDLWGELITEGQYSGQLWDVFNTTWTKE